MQQASQILTSNQDFHSSPASKRKLKKCTKCGGELEYIRPACIIKGRVFWNEAILPQLCSCQKAEEQRAGKERANFLLMEKYKAAEIPVRFLNWDFSKADGTENKKACEDYVKNFEINLLSGRGIFMVGDKGRGKSTLCYCICKELIKKGYSARVDTFGHIIKELQSTSAERSLKSYKQVLSDFARFDFTVIDDFGRETYTEKQLAVAFDFINEMSKQMKCIAITANPERIAYLKSDKFEHKVAFEAILDRLDEMCKHTTLIFEGESYRGL